MLVIWCQIWTVQQLMLSNFQIEFPGVREYTFHKLLCFLYTDEVPAVSAARCVNLLELANRLCLPRLVNLVERRVIEDLERLQPSEAIEQCLRLLEPVKVSISPEKTNNTKKLEF